MNDLFLKSRSDRQKYMPVRVPLQQSRNGHGFQHIRGICTTFRENRENEGRAGWLSPATPPPGAYCRVLLRKPQSGKLWLTLPRHCRRLESAFSVFGSPEAMPPASMK